MKKRLLAVLVAIVTALSLFIMNDASVFAATSNLSLTLSVVPNPTYNGTTVSYHISITNPNNTTPGSTVGKAINVVISFYPPGPNGLPVATPKYVSVPFNLAAGTGISLLSQNVVLALNPGITVAIANATFSATLLAGPANVPISGDAKIPLTIISPDTTVTITPSAPAVLAGGTVNLTVTEHNSGIGDLTAPNVVVTSVPGTTTPPLPLTLVKTSPNFVTGDTFNDGILSSGETWRWIVTGVVINVNTTFIADGDGNDLLGNHVNFNTVQGTTPGVTTERASTTVHIGSVTVTSPNGGESWHVGSTHDITWTSVGFTGNVKIELSRDSGATWNLIPSLGTNTGSYAWTVTGPTTANARVRVSSVNSPGVYGESAVDFTIAQGITVTAPNGGEVWSVPSTPHDITWISSVSGPVKIELSRDSGTTWNTIASLVPNTGSYAWTVYGPATTQARIRISSMYLPSVSDTSDADFTITGLLPPMIIVTAPNGGESWRVGSTHDVTWTSVGFTGNVKIELSRDSGATWNLIPSLGTNTGSYAWTVTGPTTANARVRVSSVNSPGVYGESAVDFTIAQGITVTAPNGGEVWSVPSTPHDITWISSVSGPVKIELSRDSGTTWNTIASLVPNTGSYAWTVYGPATTQARVRISSMYLPSVSDTSDADFTITGLLPPMIIVTAPNGGESWRVGSTHDVTWTSVGFTGNVKIELSRDSGATWNLIPSLGTNTGSYAWTVTGPTTANARVRVSSVNSPGVYGESAVDFTIAQGITVTAPNGGEVWSVPSTPHDITWISSVSGPVKIELSRDSGTTWNTIASLVPNTGSYTWTVHGPATTQARIRISSMYLPSVSDTSDADFTIN